MKHEHIRIVLGAEIIGKAVKEVIIEKVKLAGDAKRDKRLVLVTAAVKEIMQDKGSLEKAIQRVFQLLVIQIGRS